MMSFGPELLVIEMMGVVGSNWRINEVAETPACAHTNFTG